jgi:hypothetical protein
MHDGEFSPAIETMLRLVMGGKNPKVDEAERLPSRNDDGSRVKV